jgi:hypothetical protein
VLRERRSEPAELAVEARTLARYGRPDRMSATSELAHLFRTLKAPAAARA